MHLTKLLGAALALWTTMAAAQDQETWNAHFQSTYIWQGKPAFHSPYAGANSLLGAAERSYSVTATASLGLRLGPSTELYLDPEVAQGVPLSGLTGLSEFTNGELAKTSGPHPSFYRAKLFLRHTIGFGGGSEALESAANQLAASYDKRRIVISAGNVSALDLFDVNSYAHDPRTQFMNWAFMTHAAYDYAADSRGYTSGLVVEYFDDGWSARFGRFEVPVVPNQLRLDTRLLRHYGDQADVARDYSAAGQSGTVRLLAFRTRAVMARYQDALALADATGTQPDINAVRSREQVKWGLGLGVEHKVSAELGVFARYMRADGRTETDAFTEADRSVSAGVSVSGRSWNRAHDTFGAAVAAASLSAAHRAYVGRGGTTFFLGDGALNYRPEHVVEAYYSAALAKGLTLAADYQHIVHPGYNADRGPVNVFGVRVHWEN